MANRTNNQTNLINYVPTLRNAQEHRREDAAKEKVWNEKENNKFSDDAARRELGLGTRLR